MPDLPVMLKVTGRRCVIVGGGDVAARRARALLDAGAKVLVIAPRFTPTLVEGLAVERVERAYRDGDLAGAFLTVAATDDPAVNQAVQDEARQRGVLVNRVDDPSAGDFTVPAHAHHGPLTLAVHTGGRSAAAAAAIRRELSTSLDPDWPRLLDLIAPFRDRIQQRFPRDDPQRQARLRRLTDKEAMNILKSEGSEALRRHCDAIAQDPNPA